MELTLGGVAMWLLALVAICGLYGYCENRADGSAKPFILGVLTGAVYGLASVWLLGIKFGG